MNIYNKYRKYIFSTNYQIKISLAIYYLLIKLNYIVNKMI